MAQVTIAPYTLAHVDVQSDGRCIDCGAPIAVEHRTYKNMETHEEMAAIRVRTSCQCPDGQEHDPYTPYTEPKSRWSNPGHPNGEWLYPKWNGQNWDMVPTSAL